MKIKLTIFILLASCLVNVNAALNLRNVQKLSLLLNNNNLNNKLLNQNLLRGYSKKYKKLNLNKASSLKNRQLLETLIKNQKALIEIQRDSLYYLKSVSRAEGFKSLALFLILITFPKSGQIANIKYTINERLIDINEGLKDIDNNIENIRVKL